MPLIAAMCRDSGVPLDRIYRVSIAGNTTMNHLLLGLYADPIRMEPYIPTFFETNAFSGHDFPLGIHPDAAVLFAANEESDETPNVLPADDETIILVGGLPVLRQECSHVAKSWCR